MSTKLRPQYADAKGIIAQGFDGNAIEAEGAVVPADATAGYAPGCTFYKRAGTAGASQYTNEGTAASCAFKAVPTQAGGGAGTAVAGVAAGYKVARGQTTTVAASDTIVTGLATVVSAVANLEDAPVIGCDRAQAVIGDQAGTPAAGSILVKTFKPTATGDATPIAATTFTKKVNWIAIGT